MKIFIHIMNNRYKNKKDIFLVAPVLGILGQGKKELMYRDEPKFKMLGEMGRRGNRIPKNKIQIVIDANKDYHALFYGNDIEKARDIAKKYEILIPGDGFNQTTLKNLSKILGFN